MWPSHPSSRTSCCIPSMNAPNRDVHCAAFLTAINEDLRQRVADHIAQGFSLRITVMSCVYSAVTADCTRQPCKQLTPRLVVYTSTVDRKGQLTWCTAAYRTCQRTGKGDSIRTTMNAQSHAPNSHARLYVGESLGGGKAVPKKGPGP
jgi:hypothetical protein